MNQTNKGRGGGKGVILLNNNYIINSLSREHFQWL